jgi:ubiquinone/menaquinone biosynthesis C-methylase UbiE
MARLLARTSPASVVLDAACGTGVNAAALAHRGNSLVHAGGRDAMIDAR